MGLGAFFDNLKGALGGGRTSPGPAGTTAVAIRFADPLQPRDKHAYKQPQYFRDAAMRTLQHSRHLIADDRANGHKHVKRTGITGGPLGYLRFLQLAYTAGLDFTEIQKTIPEILDALAYCDPVYQQMNFAREHRHILDIESAYFSVMPAVAIFIGLKRETPELRQLISYAGAAGRDRLFDRIAGHFDTNRPVGDGYVVSKHHALLVEAMDADPARQSDLMKKFLDGWYGKVHRYSASHETHQSEAYTGYWSWEAAAVVMLCGIDDSSFRDHPNYPDALVDYFRAGALTQGSAG